MTKRTLFIIIGLLLLLDIAAIIIYLASKSNLDSTFDSNEATHTKADVMPDKASIDEFDAFQDTVNFLSTDKVEDGGEKKRMSATVMINLNWPKSINKSTQFLELQNALMMKLTGKTYPSVKTMIKDLTSNPKFVKPSTHFTRVNKDFSSSRGASHTTRRYTVKPHFGSHFRLDIMVVLETFNGGTDSRNFSIVHYDRQKGKVITNDQIFDNAYTSDVVALINQSIEEKMIKNNINMHEVQSIPPNFILGDKYVIFYVEQDSKQYEVKVSNESLSEYFTEYYNTLIINDTKLIPYTH